MKSILIALAALLGPLAGASTAAAQGVTHAGSGCPPGSVYRVYDRETGTLRLAIVQIDLQLAAGPRRKVRSSCQFEMPLGGEQPTRYTVRSAKYLARLQKPAGVTARLHRSYAIDDTPPITRESTWPADTSLVGDVVVEDQELGHTRCGTQALLGATVTAALEGSASEPAALMVVDYDEAVRLSFDIEATPCTP